MQAAQSNETMCYELEYAHNHWRGRFLCMASPCEVLMNVEDKTTACNLLNTAYIEAKRIEQKFSRYRNDNIIYAINHSNGKAITVDDETQKLLHFAQHCYDISDGLFDITSGVFRNIWNFKQHTKIPSPLQIKQQLKHVGWHKVELSQNQITLPKHMQIDLGGFGKEYAVDRVVQMLQQQTDHSFMVNFGGDCRVSESTANQQPWITGIQTPNDDEAISKDVMQIIKLSQGAIATSGDQYQYILHQGKRYSHIINPKTGYAVTQAPKSITVAAATCIDAGTLSTLAFLQGKNAEDFLKAQHIDYWCYR